MPVHFFCGQYLELVLYEYMLNNLEQKDRCAVAMTAFIGAFAAAVVNCFTFLAQRTIYVCKTLIIQAGPIIMLCNFIKKLFK